MAQEIINVGAAPNDGDGDPLRVAFQKVNNNFTTLFGTGYFTEEATTTGLSPNQVVFEYPADSFTQGTFIVRSYDPSTIDMQNVTLSAAITNNAGGVKFTGYGTTSEGNALCNYDMIVASGNVQVLVNPIKNSTIYHYIAYQITYESLVAGAALALESSFSSVLSTEGNVVITTEG
jgi:hypothetical protein